MTDALNLQAEPTEAPKDEKGSNNSYFICHNSNTSNYVCFNW